MISHPQAIEIFTLSLVAKIHPSVAFEILDRFWTEGVPAPSELRRSHPDFDEDKIEKTIELLNAFEDLERCWSTEAVEAEPEEESELHIDLPTQMTFQCAGCDYELTVARNAFAMIEAQLANRGCPVCGEKQHDGGWFRV